MSTSKHTPGPWPERSYPHTLDGERWFIYAAGPGVWTPESIRTIADLPAGEQAASNARLIALAPEMADYIEEMAGGDCHQYDKYLNPTPCGTCDSCRARALLARLDGR